MFQAVNVSLTVAYFFLDQSFLFFLRYFEVFQLKANKKFIRKKKLVEELRGKIIEYQS